MIPEINYLKTFSQKKHMVSPSILEMVFKNFKEKYINREEYQKTSIVCAATKNEILKGS